MSKAELIESEIAQLPADQVWELDRWLAELKARLWDEEMQRDAQPGAPLDRLAQEAIEDFHAGRTSQLPRSAAPQRNSGPLTAPCRVPYNG